MIKAHTCDLLWDEVGYCFWGKSRNLVGAA
jgi:hypothetical protein